MRPRFSKAAALVLIALLGCAHASEAPKPATTATAKAPPASTTPPPTASPPAEPPPGMRLDPSEEVTPDELGSIPDPVPGGTGAEPIVEAPLAPSAGRTGTAPSPAPTSTAPPPSASTPPATEGVWRVQVFASPDRAQADRVGREASSRLDTPYALETEGDLVKVRLGSFAREEDAQALKERAVRNGYPGAFRVLVRR